MWSHRAVGDGEAHVGRVEVRLAGRGHRIRDHLVGTSGGGTGKL